MQNKELTGRIIGAAIMVRQKRVSVFLKIFSRGLVKELTICQKNFFVCFARLEKADCLSFN